MKVIDYLRAFAVFGGTVVGVGLFGLPYVAKEAGFYAVLGYFLILMVVVIAIHYLFADIVLATPGLSRIPGYVGRYLGPRWKRVSFAVSAGGLVGVLLAYLILGGEFLFRFFAPSFGGSQELYTLLFFLAGAAVVARGIRSVGPMQLALLIVFLVMLGYFVVRALPFVSFEHFTALSPAHAILPYGVVLFSLWGLALVPEIKEMVNGSRERLRAIIFWGILFAAVCYLLFIVAIFGASGAATTPNAITGFAKALGDGVIRFGYLFGIITTFTSFITLGLTLKKIFNYDLGLSSKFSFASSMLIPFSLFWAGAKNFIEVIGATGAILLAAEGLIVLKLAGHVFAQYEGRKLRIRALTALLILGIAGQIAFFVFRALPRATEMPVSEYTARAKAQTAMIR